MKIKSTVAGLIVAASMVALIVPSQAAWSMHRHHHRYYCMGQGWHMVSKRCHIQPAMNWQQYTSGVYTQPSGRM